MNNIDRYQEDGIDLRTGDEVFDAYLSHRFSSKGLCMDCLVSERACLNADKSGPVCPGENPDPQVARACFLQACTGESVWAS